MTNPFRSLPARIVAFVFGAILITSLTVMGLAIHSIDSFLRDEINQKFPAVLTAKGDRLASWFEQREREVEVFSHSEVLLGNLSALLGDTSPARQRRAIEEIEQYLVYVLDGFSQYTALFVLDGSGEVQLWVGTRLDLDAGERGALATLERATVSDVRRLATRTVQIVSAPLGGSGPGAPAATLHAVYDVRSLRGELALDDMVVQGDVFLVDRDRRVVVSSREHADGETYSGPLSTEKTRVVVQDYERAEGERVVGGARAFARFDWTLVVEEPYDRAFAPVVGAVRSVLLIDLAIVLVVGIVGFRIAVSIIRPIEALSQAARRISEGERGIVIPETTSRDEVGVLTRAFRAMTMRLTQNAAELEASHTALEEANEQLQLQNEELQRVNEVLGQLSITDGLTKLHNHRHFQEVLLQECKRADRSERPLCLVLIDIDRFKHWNDRLGHAGGDEILRRMAEVLSDVVRETDLLARYGGEEFALIAPSTDLEGARRLAEKIRETVASTAFVIDPPSERELVTVSIGVSAYAGDRVRFFNDADRALYFAKESGRDCVMTVADLA
jgi:diguanylate cyclase (GGDEF)-like protein